MDSQSSMLVSLAIAGLTGSALTKIVEMVFNRKNRTIDGDVKLVNSAIQLTKALSGERDKLSDIIEELERERVESRDLIRALKSELDEAVRVNQMFKSASVSYSNAIVSMIDTCSDLMLEDDADDRRAIDMKNRARDIADRFRHDIGISVDENDSH